MLSVNGDTKVVMKGITHGACDYLLKPVRMEELKNIWQHVIRKKKPVPKERDDSDNGRLDAGQGPANCGSSIQKVNRKRKDQNEEEEDDSEENTNENENSNTQKKARVVWSIELHRKFMAAVNHLGVNSKLFLLPKMQSCELFALRLLIRFFFSDPFDWFCCRSCTEKDPGPYEYPGADKGKCSKPSTGMSLIFYLIANLIFFMQFYEFFHVVDKSNQ